MRCIGVSRIDEGVFGGRVEVDGQNQVLEDWTQEVIKSGRR